MKHKIIIHIGAHKTGTTSIQMKLDKDRELLHTRGVYYPKSNFQLHGQHKLAFAMKNPKDEANLTDCLKALTQELNSLNESLLVVLSSEEFFTAPLESIRQLKQSLNPFDVHILAFVRRQDNQFVSFYNERAKGLRNNFTQPAQRFLKNPILLSDELDYLHFLNQWASVFGAKKLKVQQYESYSNVVAGFFEAIGRKGCYIEDGSGTNRKNISVNLEVLEILRLVKQLTHDVTVRKKILVDAKTFFVNGTPAQKLITSEQRVAILDFFKDTNERLFKKYFHQSNQYSSDRIVAEEDAVKLKPLDIVNFMLSYVKADSIDD